MKAWEKAVQQVGQGNASKELCHRNFVAMRNINSQMSTISKRNFANDNGAPPAPGKRREFVKFKRNNSGNDDSSLFRTLYEQFHEYANFVQDEKSGWMMTVDTSITTRDFHKLVLQVQPFSFI